MKKILSVILAVAMISALFCTAAFAADSTEWLIDVIDEVNAAVEVAPEEDWVEDEEIAKVIEELDEDGLKAFEEAGFDATKVTATVMLQCDVVVDELGEGEVANATIVTNAEVESVKDITVAAFLKNAEGEYTLLGVGEPPLEVEIAESGALIIALIQ